jgi:DNA-binding NarL/FixJ family response regulator
VAAPQAPGERNGDQIGERNKNVVGQWTIMDKFVHSGFCYELRRRPVPEPGCNARLTAREEMVVARVVAGESNKSIACDLNLAPSTVGVLLFRAATKLGVRSRRELAAAYAQRSGGTGSTGGGGEPST